MKKSYTSPTLTGIGTIAMNTLRVKTFGAGDGFVFINSDTPICEVGVNCEDTSA